MLTYVKWKVALQFAAITWIPIAFVHLEPVYLVEPKHMRSTLGAAVLRGNGHGLIVDQLDECEVVFKFYRIIGVQNSFIF
jgi:hypothetical protein